MLNNPEMVQILYSVFEERRPEDKKKVLAEFEEARRLSIRDQLKELIATNAKIEEETKQTVESILRYDRDILVRATASSPLGQHAPHRPRVVASIRSIRAMPLPS